MSNLLPTIFLVTDIETTMKEKIAFDIAWKAIDKNDNCYGKGSYLSTDSVNLDAPWFKEKVGMYYKEVFTGNIEPVKFRVIKFKFNRLIRDLRTKGHKVIFCAYNAAFDTRELGKTSHKIIGEKFLTEPIQLLDIWHYWAESCPRTYTAKTTETGKNLSTTAESVYKYEFKDHRFIERHIAHYDVEIEAEILLKVLKRKKKRPLVSTPDDFMSMPWKIANERVRESKILLLAA